MDKLVYNIIHMPNKPDSLKRTFLARLVHSYTSATPNPPGGLRPPQDKDVVAILDTCLAVAITSETEGPLAAFAFGTWGGGYKALLRKYLTVDKLSDVLSKNASAFLVVGWLKEALSPVSKDPDTMAALVPVLEEYLASKLQEHGGSSAFVAALADLYTVCPILLPPQNTRLAFTISLMKCVAAFPTPTKPEVLGHMKSVGGLVNTLWNGLKLEDILYSLNAMYTIISNTDGGSEVCPAMAHLLSLVPTVVVEGLAPRIVSHPPSAPDPALHTTLTRLTAWLVAWPTAHPTLALWVRTLTRLLYQGGRNVVPARVTLDRVPKLVMALQIPVVRPGVVSVLSTLLLSFQHSPIAFHKIIPALVDILGLLEREGSTSSQSTLPRLATLAHTLMALHPGHPDTYQPLMDALQKYPSPSEEEIHMLIQEHRWATSEVPMRGGAGLTGHLRGVVTTEGSVVGIVGEGGYHQRPHGQKAGLRNLGNTCYMNSVIQALFMTDSFRHGVLHATPRSNQQLLVQLQHLFVLLCFTHRPHVAPKLFHDKSRPSWFSPGMQQDCSEYLRHLMTTLHEEEGAGQSLPEYQERVIIESETASLASSDLQPLSYDLQPQLYDSEDYLLETDHRGGVSGEDGEDLSRGLKGEGGVLVKEEAEVGDKKKIHKLLKEEPMEEVDIKVIKVSELTRGMKGDAEVLLKEEEVNSIKHIHRQMKEEPIEGMDTEEVCGIGRKVEMGICVEEKDSKKDGFNKMESDTAGVSHKAVTPDENTSSVIDIEAGTGIEAKPGLCKRKHNTSPDTAPRHTLKSPKGEMTSDLDNSSDSGISGDLAEEQISSPTIPGSPTLPRHQTFHEGGDMGLTIEEVEGSEWSPKSEYFVSLVHKVFGGKLATCIKCLQCKTESIHKDVFTDIHLAFEDPHRQSDSSTAVPQKNPSWEARQNNQGETITELSIEDLITGYLTPERLTGENQYECDRCGGKRDAERSIQILEPPCHLILTQLRFYYDTARAHRQKVFTNVDFGEELWLPIRHSTQSKPGERLRKVSAVRVPDLSSYPANEQSSDIKCNVCCGPENSGVSGQQCDSENNDHFPSDTHSDEQTRVSGGHGGFCSEGQGDPGRLDLPRRAPGEGVGSGGAGWYCSHSFLNTEDTPPWGSGRKCMNKKLAVTDTLRPHFGLSLSGKGISSNDKENDTLLYPEGSPSKTDADSKLFHHSSSSSSSSSHHTLERTEEVDDEEKGPVRYARYALYGVVVHSGFSSEGGHYYCYARSSSLAALPPTARERYGALGGWFNFNDERVTSTTFPAISSLTRTFSRDTAYQLFYRRLSDSLSPDVPLEEDLSQLRLDLQEAVEGDNLLYRSEQTRSCHPCTSARTHFPPPSDPDDPAAPPPGGCGAGPGGGSFNTPSRVVF